ncbi:MAG: hypothetical protein R2749_04580 [Acidimicrobiales bacterium]
MTCCQDLLGAEELRELLDPGGAGRPRGRPAAARRAAPRPATPRTCGSTPLRLLGPLTRPEGSTPWRGQDPAPWIEALLAERRIIEVISPGKRTWPTPPTPGACRALGCAIPIGLPAAFTGSRSPEPLVELVARFARTHGPFLVTQLGRRFRITPERARPPSTPSPSRTGGARRVPAGDAPRSEWCDADVLRQLRRRSLYAAARSNRSPQAAARFLPVWRSGGGGGARGVDATGRCAGRARRRRPPASVLEADVLATRLARYRPADLGALCTAGELVWVGAGAIGSNDGRVRLVFRDQAALLLGAEAAVAGGATPGGSQPEGAGSPDEPLHHALLAELSTRGASFWGELVAAAQRSGQPHDDASVLAALWDLVWAGLVTNDSLAPVRALVGRAGTRTTTRHDRQRGRSRPRLGRLTRTGPPAAAGRWSLVAPLLQPPPSPTEAVTARALQLLERYGVLTREAALGEGAHGGFAGVYPVLKALEERGQVRRGYFVEGLGAAQFAVPGAVDRLRAHRETDPDDVRDDGVLVLAATDPAQPFGAALPWPDSRGRPARAAGAHVLLAGGEALAYLERSGRSLLTFPAATDDDRWTTALQQLLDRGRYRQIELTRIDGDPAGESPLAPLLRTAGFRDGYRGLVLRQ